MFGKTKKLKQTISELQFMLSEKNKELEQLKKSVSIQNVLPTGYKLEGNNNKIIIVENGHERELKKDEKIPGLRIYWKSSNSIAKIHFPIKFLDCLLYISADNCYFEICSSKHVIDWHTEFCLTCKGSKIIIGENLSTGQNCLFGGFSSENLTITIGNDCMFSKNVIIRSADGHTIFNPQTNEVLNSGSDTCIGNHVWIGQGVSVAKGSHVPENCIVGEKSLICKKFSKPGCILGGVPAKVLKENVDWSRLNEPDFLRQSKK